MDINRLRAFICVAKHKSFTKASEELFISQPALSKKIADFEKEINVQLLVRDKRNVELTPAGVALYNEAPSLLGVLDDLTKKIQDISKNPYNRLSIACSGIEYDVLSGLLHKFRSTHPEISVTLRWGSAPLVKQLLLNNMVDLGFQLQMEVQEEAMVEALPFFTDNMDIIVSPYHHLADSERLTYEALQHECFLAIKPTEKHLPYEHILRYFRNRNIEFDGGLSVVDSLDTMILHVSAGFGVSLLSHKAQGRYGNVIRFIPVENAMVVETDIVWNKNNLNPSRHTFIEFFKHW